MLKDQQDAHGHAFWDYFHGKGGFEIIERDDGYFDVSGGPEAYFREFKDWMFHGKEAMKGSNGITEKFLAEPASHLQIFLKKGSRENSNF